MAVPPTVLAGKASQAIYYAPQHRRGERRGRTASRVRFNVAAAIPRRAVPSSTPSLDHRQFRWSAASAPRETSATSEQRLDSTTVVPNVLLVAGNVVETSTNGPGTEGSPAGLLTTPNGDIAEDRIVSTTGTYSATAPHGERLLGDADGRLPVAAGGPAAPRHDAPTVSITAPVAEATVSGSVMITARPATTSAWPACSSSSTAPTSAPRITASPYSVAWNTTTAANGPHTLTAVARDAAGNTTTSAGRHRDGLQRHDAADGGDDGAGAERDGERDGDRHRDGQRQRRRRRRAVQAGRREPGAEDTGRRRTRRWNTATAANGAHTLTAVARDAAGNHDDERGVTVTVNNGDTTPPTVAITAPAAARPSPALTVSPRPRQRRRWRACSSSWTARTSAAEVNGDLALLDHVEHWPLRIGDWHERNRGHATER